MSVTMTTRLGLTKPTAGTSEPMANGYDVLSDNYDLIDENCHIQYAVDESAASLEFKGKLLRDTTDNVCKLYDGTGWETISDDDWERGQVGYDINATQGTATTTEEAIRSVTFTAVNGRTYWIQYQLFAKWDGADTGDYAIRLRWAAGSTADNSSTQIDARVFYVDTTSSEGLASEGFVELAPGVDGLVTVRLSIESEVGGQSVLYNVLGAQAIVDVSDYG